MCIAMRVGFVLVVVGTVAAVVQAADPEPPSVELGKHLITIAGCVDCHTPLTMGPQAQAPAASPITKATSRALTEAPKHK